MFTDLGIENFYRVVSQNCFNLVLFTSANCAPCEAMKSSVQAACSKFPGIGVSLFRKDQEGAEGVRKKWLVGITPRTIVFKNGAEVGRMFGYLPPEVVEEKLAELAQDGRIVTTPDDAEEVSRFQRRVMSAAKVDWSLFAGEERVSKSRDILDMAASIIASTRHWASMSLAEIELLVAASLEASIRPAQTSVLADHR